MIIRVILLCLFWVSCATTPVPGTTAISPQISTNHSSYSLYGDIYLISDSCDNKADTLRKISCLVIHNQLELAEKLASENINPPILELYVQILRLRGKWDIMAQKINELGPGFTADYFRVLYYFDTNKLSQAQNALNNLRSRSQEPEVVRGLSLVLFAEQSTAENVLKEFLKLPNSLKSMPFINTYLEKFFAARNNQEALRQIWTYRNPNTQIFEIEL